MKTSLERKPTPAWTRSTVSARVTTLRPTSPFPSVSYQMRRTRWGLPPTVSADCTRSTATSIPALIWAPTSALIPEMGAKAPTRISSWPRAGMATASRTTTRSETGQRVCIGEPPGGRIGRHHASRSDAGGQAGRGGRPGSRHAARLPGRGGGSGDVGGAGGQDHQAILDLDRAAGLGGLPLDPPENHLAHLLTRYLTRDLHPERRAPAQRRVNRRADGHPLEGAFGQQ